MMIFVLLSSLILLILPSRPLSEPLQHLDNKKRGSHEDQDYFMKASISFAQSVHNKERLGGTTDGCETNEPWMLELEQFVHNPATKTLLYVYYHDAVSKKRAIHLTHCHDWMIPIHLRLSPFAESQVYRGVFSFLHHYWFEHNISYVATATYKTLGHPEFANSSLKDMFFYLKLAHSDNYDFIPILRSPKLVVPHGVIAHRAAFRPAWDSVLLAMGYDEGQIRSMDNSYAFYKSTFISKMPVFVALTNFMSFAVNMMEANSSARSFNAVNAHYPGNMTEEQKQFAFGTSYYPFYPFILERLPVFFVYNMKYKICDAHNVTFCPANIELKEYDFKS